MTHDDAQQLIAAIGLLQIQIFWLGMAVIGASWIVGGALMVVRNAIAQWRVDPKK